jgi:CheY-like chemotaxis protein
MIKEAAQRSAALTQQLLAFGRRQVLEPRILDLNAAVSGLTKMLRPLIGEDIELITSLEPALGRVKADPAQMDQVILNLAVNARDAMRQGGRLTIETADVELDEGYAVRHATVIPGPYVLLAVSDTGAGMDQQTQENIFEPFFTTKAEGKGTGLGLAMVYGIVKQSGGYIWVYSEPGQGSTFKIYFPRVEKDIQTAHPEQASSPTLPGAKTVLVVEDEGILRELACVFLRGGGYQVLEASNGAEAIQISEEHPGPIHLLLTDGVMPGMSGRQLATHLLGARPGLKVLYMSGYTEDVVLRYGMVESEMAFLQKPFTRDFLLLRVRQVLDGKQNEVAQEKLAHSDTPGS